MTERNETVKAGTQAKLVLAWLVVGVPAAWGVYNTVLRAANLFTR